MHLVNTPKFIQKAFPSIIWNSKSDPKLKITFDDGPHPESTSAILDLLESKGIKATFFCVGAKVRKYPKLFNRIIESGHGIGNHGYDHLSGWTTSKNKYIRDAMKAAELIPTNYFRPPYGRISISQFKALKKQFKIVLWNVNSWDFSSSTDPEMVSKYVHTHLQKDSILLMHDKPSCLTKIQSALEQMD